MKGSMEGVLPMLALFIMSIALATQSIPLGEALGQVVSESTSDVERIVNTRAYTDFYFYNYLPQTGEYTLNDEAYNLSREGGGLEWNSSSVDNNMYANLYLKWINESDKELNSRISGSEGICNVPGVGYSLTPYSDYDTVNKRFFIGSSAADEEVSGSPLQADCSFAGGDSFYSDSDDFYSTEYNATNNRYLGLARESVDFFTTLEESLNNIESETASKSSCSGYPSYSSVESDAAETVEEEVTKAISTVESEHPSREGFEITKLETDVDANYNYGYDSDVLDANSDGDRDTTCTCPAEEGCSTEYHTDVTVTPSTTQIDWRIKDTAYKVLVETEYENLEFRVEPYRHNFQ